MAYPDAIQLKGKRRQTLPLPANSAQKTSHLENGPYDVYADVDVFVRVARPNRPAGERAEDVTTADGYRIFAGNVITLYIEAGDVIGVISAVAGNFEYHRIG